MKRSKLKQPKVPELVRTTSQSFCKLCKCGWYDGGNWRKNWQDHIESEEHILRKLAGEKPFE